MQRARISHIGSYQYDNIKYCESPRDEIWDCLLKMTSRNYYEKNYTWEIHPENKMKCINYSIARILQAREYFEASNDQSLLTKPLLDYYCMLNLLRSLLCLMNEEEPSKMHGLKFIKGENIIDCSAQVLDGTFNDWLKYNGFNNHKKEKISLRNAIEHIIEFGFDLDEFTGFHRSFSPFFIKGYLDGEVVLKVANNEDDFDTKWMDYFPILKDYFSLSGHNTLRCQNDSFSDYSNLAVYINETFLTDLNVIGINREPIWYLYRNDGKEVMPRLSYYIIGMFILSNIVRYEPESLLEITSIKDRDYWIINKYIHLAERYFPQLLINEMYKKIIYFGFA